MPARTGELEEERGGFQGMGARNRACQLALAFPKTISIFMVALCTYVLESFGLSTLHKRSAGLGWVRCQDRTVVDLAV